MPPESSSTARLEQILTDLVIATRQIPGTKNKQLLSYGYRDNTAFAAGTVTANQWYRIKNTAGSADLSVPFTSKGGVIIIEITATLWGSTNSYRDIAPVVDGVRQPELAVSFLASGVAPGVLHFPVVVPAGDHTLFVDYRSNAGNIVDYRGVWVDVFELV